MPCIRSSCELVWDSDGTGAQYELKLQDQNGTFITMSGPDQDTSQSITIPSQYIECTWLNWQHRHLNPIVPLSHDRINVSFVVDLSSLSQRIDKFILSVEPVSQRRSTEIRFEQVFDIDILQYTEPQPLTMYHVFSQLLQQTDYQARVHAVSCGGLSSSNARQARTSRNIVIDDDLQLIQSSSFDVDTFFIALSVELQTKVKAVLPDARFARAAIEKISIIQRSNGKISLSGQVETINKLVAEAQSALDAIVSPPCSSSLVVRLADFSSQFSGLCVIKAASSIGTDDRTIQTTSAPASSIDWEEPVIFSAAALGGVILIAAAIYLIIQMLRTSRRRKRVTDNNLDLGLELSKATLY
eukprot:gene9447-1689_t